MSVNWIDQWESVGPLTRRRRIESRSTLVLMKLMNAVKHIKCLRFKEYYLLHLGWQKKN